MKFKYNILNTVSSIDYLKVETIDFGIVFKNTILPFLFAIIPLLINLCYIMPFNDTQYSDDTITSLHVGIAFIWTMMFYEFDILDTTLTRIMYFYAVISWAIVQVLWHLNGLLNYIGIQGQANSYVLWAFSFIVATFLVKYLDKRKDKKDV